MRYDVYYREKLVFQISYEASSISPFYYLDKILSDCTDIEELIHWSIKPHVDKEEDLQ